MNVHVLQHVPFEGLGSIAPWLEARGARITTTSFYADPSLPPLSELDLVIALGGPMSVNDEATLPWLRPEKQFIRDAIQCGVAVLGVCLGAQLIASALGARVSRNPVKEIGWFPIDIIQTESDVVPLPTGIPVFHWHGETFELPAGAVHLARSAACEHQAFQLRGHVVALQFHLETTPENARALVHHCPEDLVPGPYVQSGAELLAVPPTVYHEINTAMEPVLAYLTRGDH
jgi:GMP synthase-like glutamine amidotransferase